MINHAFATILSPEKVLGTYNEIKYYAQICSEGNPNANEIRKVTHKCTSNILSLENFVHELAKYRFTHRDIVETLLCNVMEHLYGLKLQMDVLKHNSSVCVFGSNVQYDLGRFVQFPTLDKDQNDYLEHVDFYINGVAIQRESLEQQSVR